MTGQRPPTRQPVTGRTREIVIGLDRLIYFFTRHWLATFNLIVGLYVGLPILAPVLMNAGLTGPANTIYTIYSPMCHQMASRSFFLFGEQYAYPRPLAGSELTPLDAYLDQIPEFTSVDPDNWVAYTFAARRFVGNAQLGYKMALCERDISIYLFVFIGGLLYAGLRRRFDVPPLSFLLFVILGMGPIGLDGFSQLFGYYAVPPTGGEPHAVQEFLARLFPLRESTPFLRSFTGGLFGLMLAWLAYPRVDEGMKITERQLAAKLQRAGAIADPASEAG